MQISCTWKLNGLSKLNMCTFQTKKIQSSSTSSILGVRSRLVAFPDVVSAPVVVGAEGLEEPSSPLVDDFFEFLDFFFLSCQCVKCVSAGDRYCGRGDQPLANPTQAGNCRRSQHLRIDLDTAIVQAVQ